MRKGLRNQFIQFQWNTVPLQAGNDETDAQIHAVKHGHCSSRANSSFIPNSAQSKFRSIIDSLVAGEVLLESLIKVLGKRGLNPRFW